MQKFNSFICLFSNKDINSEILKFLKIQNLLIIISNQQQLLRHFLNAPMRKCLQLFKCPYELINYIAPPTYEDLKIAVIKGDIQKINSLIENKVPFYGNGQTILHFCLLERNVQLLKKFCLEFPDLIDQRNDDGDNPYMMAVYLWYKEAMAYLAEKSNFNICDNNGNTVFMIAAANGDIDTLRMLLFDSRQHAMVKNFQGQNALHRACYFGQIQTVSYLIKRTELKFGMKDRKGNTSLHLACKGLSFGTARYIINKVQNWKQTLIGKNKQNNDPLDLMLESLSKIGEKSIKYTKRQLQMAIFGEVIAKMQVEKNSMRQSEKDD